MKKGEIVIIASDHAGYERKEKLKRHLEKRGIALEDYGAFKYDKEDDYTDFAFKVGEKVAADRNSLGILICGTGEGMVIAANKVKGIRAVEGYDSYSAKMSRMHNNANILGLRARKFSFAKTKKIVDTWLNAEFSGEKRHTRRLNKIASYEK